MAAPAHADVVDPMLDLIAPDSLLARAAGLWGFLPANGAAFILQVMHPTIGDVVGKYSVYRTDPFGRAVRSVDSLNLWVYGESAAIEEGHRLRRLHQPLQMVNDQGERISALNPQPYGWVIATGFASTVWMWPHMFGRVLTLEEEQQLFGDFVRLAGIVQIPAGYFPATHAEFWPYFDEMVTTTIVNHRVAQDLLGQLSSDPARRALYLLTVSLLPPEIREVLAIDWTWSDAAAAKVLWSSMRLSMKYLPDRVKYTPIAYHSLQRARAIAAIKDRALSSFV